MSGVLAAVGARRPGWPPRPAQPRPTPAALPTMVRGAEPGLEQSDCRRGSGTGDVEDALGEQEWPLGLHGVACVPPLLPPAVGASP